MTNPSVATADQFPRARWWAVVGILSAVLGIAASSAWFIWGLSQLSERVETLIIADGGTGTEIVVDELVDWAIYLEPSRRSLSGIRFEIVDVTVGEPVQLERARNDVVYEVGGRSGRPISRARLDPGQYRVLLSPNDATLTIGPDVGDLVQQIWVGAVVIALPSVLGGAVLAAVNVGRALRTGPTPTVSSSLYAPGSIGGGRVVSGEAADDADCVPDEADPQPQPPPPDPTKRRDR